MDSLLAFLTKRGEAIIVFLILLAGTLFCMALLSTGDLASQLGETIGGITAPILSFSGIVLLYLTFREHIQSVRIQERTLREQREAQRAHEDTAALIQLFDTIHNNLRQAAFIEVKTGRMQTGFCALRAFSRYLPDDDRAAPQISDDILRDFLLSLRAIVRGMQAYLARNATAALSREQRVENYGDLDMLRGPLDAVFESCLVWARYAAPDAQQQSELIRAIHALKPALDSSFRDYDPASEHTAKKR